jgi:effector-binding domain-containing protein
MTAVHEQAKTLPLTLETDPVHFPATHYVFIEKHGNIPSNAGPAWTQLHAKISEIEKRNTITGYMSLYKMDDAIYRAGVALAAAPQQLPDGLTYEQFAGGIYRKFVLRGSYAQLPEATSQAVRAVRENGIQLRNDFSIEHYVTDPRTTPEDQLLTEILFPVKEAA